MWRYDQKIRMIDMLYTIKLVFENYVMRIVDAISGVCHIDVIRQFRFRIERHIFILIFFPTFSHNVRTLLRKFDSQMF